MASITRIFVQLLPLIALFPLAVRSQGHTCVYCRSVTQEAPDPTAQRLACSRNVQQPITCPVTGTMPDCDDPALFQPAATDLPDGCDVIDTSSGRPVFRSFECQDVVRFAGQTWGLRAVITDPACPDSGSIWTECSYSTPLCQPRQGIASSQVQGGFQVATENPTTAGAVMTAPAPEGELPVVAPGVVMGPAPTAEMVQPTAPAPEREPPHAEVVPGIVGVTQPAQQNLPGVTSTTTPGGGLR